VNSGVPATLPPLTKRMLGWEIVVVFAVSLGANSLFALINLIGSLTAPKALRQQQALLVGSLAPGRPLLDLTLQLASIVTTLAPVALVFYLLAREGEGLSALGIDTTRPASDVLRGAVLAAVIGGTGLALYVAAFHLGISLNVVPEDLPAIWWRIPVLLLDAAQNGILEEVLVLGYVQVIRAAVVRGSYHLYQGFGGFIGNAILGVIFGVLYRRWGRVTPMIIAHTLIDAGAFVGYAVLHGHVSWLP
jgi:membrane protease YdiL (CAAX protease family)